MTEALQQLIDAVKTLAPQVWEIYMRQAMVNGWMSLGGGLFLTVICVIAIIIGLKEHRKGDDENDVITVIGFMGGGFGLILSVGMVVTGIQYLMNPAYYAIKMLIHP